MIKKFWKQFINNFDSALAILVSIIAAVYGVLDINQLFLLSAISGTLGLLAFGMIKDRHAREELLKQVQQLKESPGADAILLDRGKYLPFNDLTFSAQEIYLVGPSLVNLFNQWSTYFKDVKLKEHGATIQAIILDPHSPAVKSAANCVNQSQDALKNEIRNTKLLVGSILKNSAGSGNGKLELRTLATYLNFSMVLIDPEKPNGKIFVEFIGYQAGMHNVPHIELSPSRDGEWYQFYLEQYKNIYRDSRVSLKTRQSGRQL